MITIKHLEKAYSWQGYLKLTEERLERGLSTSPEQDEELYNYSKLNLQRMKRLEKKTALSAEMIKALEKIQNGQIWIILTESWCGDASQNLVAIAKMAEANPMVQIKILLRDSHPDVMEQYLTNGAKSIPKVIFLDAETLEEKAVWGPRPQAGYEMLMEYKNDPSKPKADFYKNLQQWYNKDKSATIQEEFIEIITNKLTPAAADVI